MEITDLIGQFYSQLWNQWDDELVDELLDETFEFRGSLGQSTHGRDGWRSYRDQIRVGSPDFHNEILSLVCDENHGAARLQYRGTHTGPLLGIAPTGRAFTYAGAAFFEASNGYLISAWVLGDLENLRSQLQ
ncbi:MAG: ester cyclase [Ferrimicrobium sp.]